MRIEYVEVEGQRVPYGEYQAAFAGKVTCSTEPLSLEMIRPRLDVLVAEMPAKVERLEEAQKVSRETMELEFTV